MATGRKSTRRRKAARLPQPLPEGARPRVILADDHRLLVESLERMLARSCDIVGIAHDGDQLMEVLEHREADCLLLDLEMPGKNGLSLLPAIRRQQRNLRVIILTMMVDRALVEACLAAGAAGYVPKEASIDELETAINAVLEGQRYISPRVPKSTHRMSLDARHRAFQRLTPRQQDIMIMFGQGKTAMDISRALDVSPSTITFHRQNIERILGMDEPTLMQYAVLLMVSEKRED